MENTKPWFVTLILLVFTAGILAGILLDKKFFTAPPVAATQAMKSKQEPSDGPPITGFKKPKFDKDKNSNPREHIVAMLTQTLELDQEQQIQVDAILQKFEPEMLAMQDDIEKRMTEMRERIDKEIQGVLNDTQLGKFKEMKEQMEKIKDKHGPMPFPGGGGPGGGPGGNRGPGMMKHGGGPRQHGEQGPPPPMEMQEQE